MKIIITGGAGFIGTNFCLSAIKMGHEVVIVDDISRKGTKENLATIRNDLAFNEDKFFLEKIDITDSDKIIEVFKEHHDAELIVHLAAQVAVTTSISDPRLDFEINALGTFNILEAMRAIDSKALLIFSSTNKVYGNLSGVSLIESEKRYQFADLTNGINEKQQLDFHSPYGCSKGVADQYVRDYSRIYKLNTVVVRQSCIYGINQLGIEDQGWVAWFTIAAMMGKEISIYGDGKQVRDVLYIDDLVNLYWELFRCRDECSGKIFNAGGGMQNSLSLIELLDILDANNLKVSKSFADQRKGDQKIFISDNRKLKEFTGWEPLISPKEGTEKLIVWVRKNLDKIKYLLG